MNISIVKKIFGSLLKSFTITIIISLIGYNLYSPVTKDPIYQLEIKIEPNPLVITFGRDSIAVSNLRYEKDNSNNYEVLKFLKGYVNELHKFQSIGNCSIKKIKGRVPYTLTQQEQFYQLIDFKLLGSRESLKKCQQDINNRIKNLFDKKKMIMMSKYNEISFYDTQYKIEKNSKDAIISMRLFDQSGQSGNSNQAMLQEIYDNLVKSYSDYYKVINGYTKKIIQDYQFIVETSFEINLYEDNPILLKEFLTPLVIFLNLFLIILISLIDLIYFKKVNLKKIYKFLFS